MNIFNFNKTTLFLSLMITLLSGLEPSLDGCSSSVGKATNGCSSDSILIKKKEKIFKIKEEVYESKQTNISKELKSINVNHKGKELTIVRNIVDNKKSCPPHCIAPMAIDGVETIGELETLDFIKGLKENRNNLLLDTRDNRYYNKSTIPGALNLPSHMLQESSKYFKDVITILGINKVNSKWQVKDIRTLLIFDDGITDNKASKAIISLLKLSYPSDKILYYRGGFSSWKSLGLTLY